MHMALRIMVTPFVNRYLRASLVVRNALSTCLFLPATLCTLYLRRIMLHLPRLFSCFSWHFTARQNCTDGYYCAKGAAAALPCPGGSTERLGVTMTRQEDCDVCGEGTFCPVGSGAATNCSAGTFNDEEKQEACSKCAAGTFQDVEGATACKVTRLAHRS